MNSFKKLSFLMIAAALVLSPVAKAADAAAPVVGSNPTAATADASPSQDKTLLAKPAPTKKEMAEAKCDGGKKCKMGDNCKCKGKKHCKYCKDKKEHAHDAERDATDSGDKAADKTN